MSQVLTYSQQSSYGNPTYYTGTHNSVMRKTNSDGDSTVSFSGQFPTMGSSSVPPPLYGASTSVNRTVSSSSSDKMSFIAAPAPVLRNGEVTILSSDPPSVISAPATVDSVNSQQALISWPAEEKNQSRQKEGMLIPVEANSPSTGTDLAGVNHWKYRIPELPHKTYPPEVEKMKIRRKQATIAVGLVGGIAGLAVAGPLGAIVVGGGGALTTRAIGKRRERQRREKIACRVIAEQHRNAPEPPGCHGELL